MVFRAAGVFLEAFCLLSLPVFRCFQSDHFRTFSGPSASRIGDKIVSISVQESVADLITCSRFCKLKPVPLL